MYFSSYLFWLVLICFLPYQIWKSPSQLVYSLPLLGVLTVVASYTGLLEAAYTGAFFLCTYAWHRCLAHVWSYVRACLCEGPWLMWESSCVPSYSFSRVSQLNLKLHDLKLTDRASNVLKLKLFHGSLTAIWVLTMWTPGLTLGWSVFKQHLPSPGSWLSPSILNSPSSFSLSLNCLAKA